MEHHVIGCASSAKVGDIRGTCLLGAEDVGVLVPSFEDLPQELVLHIPGIAERSCGSSVTIKDRLTNRTRCYLRYL
jgi:hypothetical protein